MTTTAARTPPSDGVRRKSTLFCPGCDHESPVDGDWVLEERTRGTAYECPDCGVTLTVRPVFDDDERAARRVRAWFSPVDYWTDYLQTVQRAAHAWYPTSTSAR
ncbi:hypothetical protein [Haloarchaeobius sp. DT45]|uniref:hypothetical protein n=1 Tax=Haloarchaeobius sp. DT45 TaxID=3446116 RepID=UPI003F6BA3E2